MFLFTMVALRFFVSKTAIIDASFPLSSHYTVVRCTKSFNCLLNICGDLISFNLVGKLFHTKAPIYLTENLTYGAIEENRSSEN